MSKQDDKSNSEINPHMPQYIVKAPWYLNQTENSLKHQKAQVEVNKLPITIHTLKGVMKEKGIYKFRKGACENCGAVTHKTKECCERPRKKGSKWTGSNFCPDEYICEVPLDYEGKRDRWNGYNPDSFKRIMIEHERLVEEKNRYKSEKFNDKTDESEKRKILRDEDRDESVSSEDENLLLRDGTNNVPDEFKAVAEVIESQERDNPYVLATGVTDSDVITYLDKVMNEKNSKIKQVIDMPKEILYRMCASKSLHIGDDYSKYLLNLALNSAYYDGKSRSMREDPNPGAKDTFRGDNYSRNTGDTLKLLDLEKFIREANEKNKDLNLNNISMPSQAELFYSYFKNKKSNLNSDLFKKVVSKYGGEEYLKIPDEVKTILQPDYDEKEHQNYSENPEKILPITFAKKIVKSSYQEDILINDHKTVWGSYYHKFFGWGFKCCLSFDKNSTCKGEEGVKFSKKIIAEHDLKIEDKINKQKQAKKEKDDELTKRNMQDEYNGIFSDAFDKMERYEQSGKLINQDSSYLSKKVNRDKK